MQGTYAAIYVEAKWEELWKKENNPFLLSLHNVICLFLESNVLCELLNWAVRRPGGSTGQAHRQEAINEG